jgi:hypothetical protein
MAASGVFRKAAGSAGAVLSMMSFINPANSDTLANGRTIHASLAVPVSCSTKSDANAE